MGDPNGFTKLRVMSAKRLGLVTLATAVLLSIGFFGFSRLSSGPRTGDNLAPLRILLRDLRAQTPVYYYWSSKPPISRLLPKAWLDKAHMAWILTNDQRRLAVWKLKMMGTNAWPAVPALVKSLDASDYSVSVLAANVLAGIRADESPDWRQAEQMLLDKRRPAKAFLYLLMGRDPLSQRSYDLAFRRFGLVGLAATGRAGSLASQEITNILRFEDDPELRAKAVLAAAAIECDRNRIVPFLKPILQNGNEWPQVRAASAQALARTAPNDPATRDLLRQACLDDWALVRLEAARSLWKLKQPADEILAVLVPLLSHKLVSIRSGALKVLAEMGNAARPSLPAIEQLASDKNESLRRASAAAIESITPSDTTKP